MRRGLREDAKSGSLTPRLRHRVFVRRTSGACSVLPDAFSGRSRGDRNRAIPKREEVTGAGSQPVKPRSAKSAERLAAGALTGRPDARKSPPAMFGMSFFASAGANFSRRQCESREELIGIRPDPNKSSLADMREPVIVCAQLSCMTSRSNTRKPVEFLVILRPTCGAHTPAKEPRFPLPFLGVRGGGL
jgi:hypothetical protein